MIQNSITKTLGAVGIMKQTMNKQKMEIANINAQKQKLAIMQQKLKIAEYREKTRRKEANIKYKKLRQHEESKDGDVRVGNASFKLKDLPKSLQNKLKGAM